MIKPETLWGLFKSCDNSAWLGDICRALGGQQVSLDYGQAQMVKAVKQDSAWLDERTEAQRAKWQAKKRRQREGDKRGQKGTEGDNGDISPVPQCPHSTYQPTNLPTNNNYPISDNSVCDRQTNEVSSKSPTVDNETIRRYRTMANAFALTLKEDISQAGAIFHDESFDSVAIACGLTGEYSIPLWKSYRRDCGEWAFREEMLAMWDEIQQGEIPKNRASALNKRLRTIKELKQNV